MTFINYPQQLPQQVHRLVPLRGHSLGDLGRAWHYVSHRRPANCRLPLSFLGDCFIIPSNAECNSSIGEVFEEPETSEIQRLGMNSN